MLYMECTPSIHKTGYFLYRVQSKVAVYDLADLCKTIEAMSYYMLLLFLIVLHQNTTSGYLVSANSMVAKPNCRDKCGNITIPYPFGIGRGCFFDKPFEIICGDDDDGYIYDVDTEYPPSSPFKSLAYSPWIQEMVHYISMDTIRIRSTFLPVSYNTSSGKNLHGDRLGKRDELMYYSFPESGNKFVAVGCDISAYLQDPETGDILAGCASFCNMTSTDFNSATTVSSCTGSNGCCQCPISRITKDIKSLMYTMNTHNASWATDSCSYSNLAQSGSVRDLLTNRCTEQKYNTYGEIALDWVVSNMSCEQAAMTSSNLKVKACGEHTDCVNSRSIVGYTCQCSPGFQGNPYLSNGCQDINECAGSNGSPCPHNTLCVNTLGSYHCAPNDGSKPLLYVCIGIATAVGFIAFVAGCLLLHQQIKIRKEEKAKQKFFRRNGGMLMQRRISASEGNDSALLHMKLFKKEELEKATDNFNESRIAGKGGLGTVYKGMLSDGSIVAIKKSNVVDEDQVGHFVNEIFILSQINHRHIVKVLGCCLETQVPLLVYEYISNGTLSSHLHAADNSMTILPLEHRLRIAKEIAEALGYLHSFASSTIFHRDIKSSNILLDENYRAVVSDFGLSRLVPIEITHLITRVGGTFGYLDPEYFRSGKLNDKSDVYAFGVVLLELLTSQRAVSSDAASTTQGLAMRFESMVKQSRLLEMVDLKILRDVESQDMVLIVAKLAKRCLKLNAKARPSMKEVAAELDEITKTRHDVPLRADSFQSSTNTSPTNGSLYSYPSDSLIDEDNW